ncbi:hypothetical protein VNO77_21210 [Canavalia gladiata]|uniref:Neprosin PEP catalytic domain-containing protein n=1 Tax=Canavalia gladiata TaxID=3824 RepID=A0AAN9QLW3_CANGL
MALSLQLLLVLCMCLLCHKVDARNHSHQKRLQRFSRSQKFESVLLMRDNEFDCVDIYKQPAFQHSMLKNHKIQLSPTFKTATTQSRPSKTWKDFKGKNMSIGCPPGKVPIHRGNMMHQTNSTHFVNQFPGYAKLHANLLDTNKETTYHGGYAEINICKVSGVEKGQYSLAQVYAHSDAAKDLDIIKVGWGVDQDGCYNVVCPGFVQVSSELAFGAVMTPNPKGLVSESYVYIGIEQDHITGHWWFVSGKNPIGYWPKELLPHISNGAAKIRFGGETASSLDNTSPPMGNGILPEGHNSNSCFFAGLRIMDSEFHIQEIKPEDITVYSDTNPHCYGLLYEGYQGELFRQSFFFGGPGGDCGV